MLTPDEIKKLIEIAKPEGFIGHEKSCSSYTIEYLKSAFEIEYDTLKGSANREVYELFLQRCIEGINRKSFNAGSAVFKYRIYQDIDCFRVRDQLNHIGLADFYFMAKGTIDQAKEEALRYILEQMEG